MGNQFCNIDIDNLCGPKNLKKEEEATYPVTDNRPTLVLRRGHTSPAAADHFLQFRFSLRKSLVIKFQRACMLPLWSHNRTWL